MSWSKVSKALRLFLLVISTALIVSCKNHQNQKTNPAINSPIDVVSPVLNCDDGITEMMQAIESFQSFTDIQKDFVKNMLTYIYSEVDRYLNDNKSTVRKAKLDIGDKVTFGLLKSSDSPLEILFQPGSPISGKSVEIQINKSISSYNEQHRNERLDKITLDQLPNMVDISYFENSDLGFDDFFDVFKKQILSRYNSFISDQKLLEQLAGINK